MQMVFCPRGGGGGGLQYKNDGVIFRELPESHFEGVALFS